VNTDLMEIPARDKMNWLTTIVLIVLHIGAIAALFTFSWTNLAVATLLYWVATGLGISMGYHRLHTHRSYKVPVWLEYFFAICGALTLEGGQFSGWRRTASIIRNPISTATRIHRVMALGGRTWAGFC
jgi:fatty-acid desaturase